MKVVITEAVQLAKEFGAQDGHRYINALLDRLAPKLRPAGLTATGARRWTNGR